MCPHSSVVPPSRIAVFSVTVFYDERIVIVAEQRPDASEEDSFQWMSRVLQVNLRILLVHLFHKVSAAFFLDEISEHSVLMDP